MAKKKVSIVRILVVGVAYAIVSMIVHTFGAQIGMPYYMDQAYSQVWSKLMMPALGPPPTTFYVYSFVFAVLTGILFALVYQVIKDSIPVKNVDERGILYGLLVFLVSGLPSTLSMYLLVSLPLPLIAMWAVESWVVALLGGIIVAQAVK